MLQMVAQAIEEFYIKKNYPLFKELCKKPLDLSEELKTYIKKEGLALDGWGGSVDPDGEWAVNCGSYEQGTFKASYTTCLRISKVAPLFNVGHCYGVENQGNKIIEPDLGDCSDNPYTKKQQKLHEMIAADLTSKGYVELRDIDLEETIADFKMPEGVTIFGPNVTVELLLFRDIYNILGDDN